MRIDTALSFVPLGGTLSLVGGAGVAIPSTYTLDVFGVGPGIAPPSIWGAPTLAGWDVGIGGDIQEIQVSIGTALATSNSATLTVAFQGAPDTGAAGGYQPGTWTTYADAGAVTAANGTANQVIRLDWPAAFPANARPRFYRLNFVVPAGTNFTAGTVSWAGVTMVRDDLNFKYAARNYTVA